MKILGLVILFLFVSLFLIKNVFFSKNLNKDIIALENPKSYDINLSSKALVIKRWVPIFLLEKAILKLIIQKLQ